LAERNPWLLGRSGQKLNNSARTAWDGDTLLMPYSPVGTKGLWWWWLVITGLYLQFVTQLLPRNAATTTALLVLAILALTRNPRVQVLKPDLCFIWYVAGLFSVWKQSTWKGWRRFGMWDEEASKLEWIGWSRIT
jgi:hypothetical protein